ncbi:MAG: hypothetical protein ACU0BS_00675 [Hasllibacter sp.]
MTTPAAILAAPIDRAAVMTLAWETARAAQWSARAFDKSIRTFLAGALREAWATLRLIRQNKAATMARMDAAVMPYAAHSAFELRGLLNAAENAATRDAERIAILREAHRRAVEAEREAKRGIIVAAGSRLAAVTFIKADGTLRRMSVQPAALAGRVKGDAASPSAQAAARTRAANNPHLLNVWDAQRQAPRSINLDTVLRIAADGREHLFAPTA